MAKRKPKPGTAEFRAAKFRQALNWRGKTVRRVAIGGEVLRVSNRKERRKLANISVSREGLTDRQRRAIARENPGATRQKSEFYRRRPVDVGSAVGAAAKVAGAVSGTQRRSQVETTKGVFVGIFGRENLKLGTRMAAARTPPTANPRPDYRRPPVKTEKKKKGDQSRRGSATVVNRRVARITGALGWHAGSRGVNPRPKPRRR